MWSFFVYGTHVIYEDAFIGDHIGKMPFCLPMKGLRRNDEAMKDNGWYPQKQCKLPYL
jgi:hypothetical protein